MPPGPSRPASPAGSLAVASPSPHPSRSPRVDRSRDRLASLLTDLGSQVRRGAVPDEPLPRHPSGLIHIDALLDGGFPGGRLSEIAGPPSSGRTSIALALLARTTAEAGELAAVVDRADAFDPTSAEAAGVDLERVLWARVGEWREALRCVERLLETEGIPLVLLDLGMPPGAGTRASRRPSFEAFEPTAWTRLARLAAGTRTALIALTPQRMIGAQAEIVLALEATRPHFSGAPRVLEELETRATLVRHRAAPVDRTVTIRLGGGRALHSHASHSPHPAHPAHPAHPSEASRSPGGSGSGRSG